MARVFTAGVLGGLGISLLDVALAHQSPSGAAAGFGYLMMRAVCSWAAIGGVVGLCVALVYAPLARVRNGPEIAAAICWFPIAIRVAATLFEGPVARALPVLPLLRIGTAAFLATAGVVAIHLLVKAARWRPVTALVAIAIAGSALLLHLRFWPRQYPAAHEALVFMVLMATSAIPMVVPDDGRPVWRPAAIAAVLGILVRVAGFGTTPSQLPIASTLVDPVRAWIHAVIARKAPALPPIVVTPWTTTQLVEARSALRLAGLPPKPSCVFVTIDALSARLVGCLGGESGITPNMDALGRSGTVFTHARTAATLTTASVLAFLSARRPERLTAHPAPDAIPLLPDQLESAGYRTFACFPGWAMFGTEVTESAFQRTALGFDESVTENISDARRVDRTLAFVRGAGSQPFFAWTHFMGPHAPYAVSGDDAALSGKARYLRAIREADAELGRLITELHSSPQTAGALLIIAADHGEEFGEHGAFFHGLTLYEAALHVPLIIAGPGIPVRRVDDPVSLLDITPTLTDFAGLGADAALDGRALTPLIAGTASGADRTVFADQIHALHEIALSAVVHGAMKGILNRRNGGLEIYDLAADPDEHANVALARPEVAESLRALLEAPPVRDNIDPVLTHLLELSRDLAGHNSSDPAAWRPLFEDPRRAVRRAAIECIQHSARNRALLRDFARAPGPAGDDERLYALELSNDPPDLADLGDADWRFRLAAARALRKTAQKPDPGPLAARLWTEPNREICFELLVAISWAWPTLDEKLVRKIASGDDAVGARAAMILAQRWVDEFGRPRPGTPAVESAGIGVQSVGEVALSITIPAGESDDTPWRNWLFVISHHPEAVAVRATAGDATFVPSVYFIDTAIAISIPRATQSTVVHLVGGTERPQFGTAFRVPNP